MPAAKKAAAKKTAAKSTEVDEQFPALDGKSGVEVAQRSADVTEDSTDTHKKVFVVRKADYDEETFNHDPNVAATRQYLINQGMRPAEDGSFSGAEDNKDGRSVNLTYSVKVIPADVAHDPEVKNASVVPDSK